MNAADWLFWFVLSAAGAALSVWHYRRRETPGRGRLLLAALRSAAIALVLLVLWDPQLPGSAAARTQGSVVLLDGSVSMGADSSAWASAVAAARERSGERPVLVWGDVVRPTAGDSLAPLLPHAGRSRLLPALQAAAEAGARDVVVITDGRVEDAAEVARWLPRLGLRVETVMVGDDVANRSLAEADAPPWVPEGEPFTVRFAVRGGGADSVRVMVRSGGRVVGTATLPPAGPGRAATGTVEIQLAAPPEGELVALEVALDGADSVPDDDVRTLLVRVSPEPSAVALISFRPDWEPRFLAPVLQQALGLPLRAWLSGADGAWIRLDEGEQAGTTASLEQVQDAARRAELLVLHAPPASMPPWAADAAAGARRLLVLPAGAGSAPGAPVELGADTGGDFWIATSVPPSPLAPLLTGLELGALPPLQGLYAAEAPAGSWAPLLATRGRQGAPQPVLVAGEGGGRRWAVALGTGYWQWAFRGGSDRQAYARFWSAVGGWLAREQSVAGLPPVRPADAVSPRGTGMQWVAPGLAPDSMSVTWTRAGDAGAQSADTMLTAFRGDTATSRQPAPGMWQYQARAWSGDDVVEGAGTFVVERYSSDYGIERIQGDALAADDATVVRGVERGATRGGTPLHATPWPWLLVLLLLSAEWILRRRWGLR